MNGYGTPRPLSLVIVPVVRNFSDSGYFPFMEAGKYRRIFVIGILGASVALTGSAIFTGCVGLDPISSDTGSSRTNDVEAARPVYRVDAPSVKELAGTYRSQDRNYHDSMILIFEDGEFIWHSRTDTVQVFRGLIYDVNTNGFSVGLNDRSGDSLHFQFSPDKRSFFSVDETGRTLEEYRK